MRKFEDIADDSEVKPLLVALDKAKLCQLSDLISGRENIRDRHQLDYVVERVCLSDPARVPSYLEACGTLCLEEADTSMRYKLTRALYDFLVETDEAEKQPIPEECEELRSLLSPWRRRRFNRSFVKLPAEGDLYVVGDLHGDGHVAGLLAEYFRSILEKAKSDRRKVFVVFLGDYVNNGLNSIRTLGEVLRLHRQFRKNVILLSGNHEFAETYATAFTEFFKTHWEQWREFSGQLSPDFKRPPRHYGHIRTELVRSCGITTAEALYAQFVSWGRSLPFLALSRKGILMCHSLGLADGDAPLPSKKGLMAAKRDREDIKELENFGYEAWKRRRRTPHAQMVNGRKIMKTTLDHLGKLIGNKVFIVGHTHYRSGDRDRLECGELRRAGRGESGVLLTLCSSHPRSPDAGHYIAYEFESSRGKEAEGQARTGVACPCVAHFTDRKVSAIEQENILTLGKILGC